jgi:lysylphosphatidylglycerol synthetase-like protein (DUF2156 family)
MEPVTTGTAVTTAVALLLFVVVTKQLTNFLKYLRAGDWNAVVTNVVGFLVAFGVALLFANSSWSDLTLPALDRPLADLSIADLFIVGLAGMSGAGFLYDRAKAIDNSQSAATPSLVPPKNDA